MTREITRRRGRCGHHAAWIVAAMLSVGTTPMRAASAQAPVVDTTRAPSEAPTLGTSPAGAPHEAPPPTEDAAPADPALELPALEPTTPEPSSVDHPADESSASDAAAADESSAPEPAAETPPLREGLNPPRTGDLPPPLYPGRAYDEEMEADVILDVELDAMGAVRRVEATRLLLVYYDEDGQLVEREAPLDEDTWGFIPAAEDVLRASTWSPAVMVDDASPEGRAVPVVVERLVRFMWEEAVLEAPDTLDETGADDPPLVADADAEPSVEDAHVSYALGEDPSLPVNYEGRVQERGTRRPVPGAQVSAFREPDGPRVDVLTDTSGRFALRGLPPGEWYVLIDEDGYEPLEAREQLSDEDAVVVTYRINRSYFDAYRSETVEEPPAREVTRRSLETVEIQRIPGTNNDALRVVQNLPGVARAPFSGGSIIVRGSEPTDSGVFIDGMPIPALYHFGALRSVIPTEIVEKLDFYPGNFGVRYGRATGGVLEVETTMRQAEQWGGHIDVNLFDAGAFVEGPISDRLTLQLGVRRSYIDALLLAVKEVVPFNLTVAPRYYDYQARLLWKISDRTNASLMVFGSDDLADLVLDEEDDIDPGIRGGFRSSQSFHSVLMRVDTRLSDRLENTFRAIGGVQNVGLSAGQDFYLNVRMGQLAFRDELRITAKDNLDFRVGVDMQITPARVSLRLPQIPSGGDAGLPFEALRVSEISERLMSFAPGVYVETDYRPIERLQLIPGVRADYYSLVGEWAAEARLGARYSVSDAWLLKAAIGNFHRAPDPNEILRDFGNPDLGLEHAIHYSIGTEWKITEYLQFDVEVFYKDMRALVSPSQQLVESGGVSRPEIFNMGGIGRVYGAEFFLRHQLANNFFGWVTYTFSKAERLDDGASDWRLFESDQTHILTLLGSYNLPKNWSIGGRFRLVSGNLYTPIVGATYDASSGSYVGVSGPMYSERHPLFHQLDVRVDKRWVFRDWTLNLYLDIQNIYNRQNPEGLTYSYDFSKTGQINGLPFIPAFGIRGEF